MTDGEGRAKMRWLFALVALALTSVGVSACGNAMRAATAPRSRVANSNGAARISSTLNGSHLEEDEDDDDEGEGAGTNTGSSSHDSESANSYSINNKYDNDADFDNDQIKDREYYDKDDGMVAAFGHNAGPSEGKELTALVRSYEADSATGDGAAACALMYRLLARTIPESYGRPPGPPALRGTTCQAVMDKLFRQLHKQLIRKFQIMGVRVKGNLAYVLMGAPTLPAGYMSLKREAGSWKISAMLSGPLP
jgi:hypothetical protein